VALDAGMASSSAGFSVGDRLNLRHTDDTAQGTTTHSPSNVHETRAAGAVMIAKDTASVMMGLALRCLEESCVMLIF
jgi:hypothetical protein